MVKHTQTFRRQFADKLFECVWPFCEIGAQRVNWLTLAPKDKDEAERDVVRKERQRDRDRERRLGKAGAEKKWVLKRKIFLNHIFFFQIVILISFLESDSVK